MGKSFKSLFVSALTLVPAFAFLVAGLATAAFVLGFGEAW